MMTSAVRGLDELKLGLGIIWSRSGFLNYVTFNRLYWSFWSCLTRPFLPSPPRGPPASQPAPRSEQKYCRRLCGYTEISCRGCQRTPSRLNLGKLAKVDFQNHFVIRIGLTLLISSGHRDKVTESKNLWRYHKFSSNLRDNWLAFFTNMLSLVLYR